MELPHLPRHRIPGPTLGELLKRVDDAQNDTPPHRFVHLPSPPSSFPFILSFTNLTYSVKLHRKSSLPQNAVVNTSATKTTKTLDRKSVV